MRLKISAPVPALVGFLILAACTSAATKQSVKLYERGDYQGAAKAADGGIASDKGDDGAWQMRMRAALALGDAAGIASTYQRYREARGGDDGALALELAEATLQQGLTSPSVALRIAAIRAVEESELAGLADAVAQRMTDPDDRVVAAAAAAVLRGYADAGEALDDMMRSEDAEARRIALDGLGRKMAKYAAGELEQATKDGEASVRRTAIHHLAPLRDKAFAMTFLLHANDPDDGVRAEAVAALAELALNDKELQDALAKAQKDRALPVRMSAVRLAVALDNRAALAVLLGDADVTVALAAAAALRSDAASLTALFDRALGAGSDGASKVAALNQASAMLGAAAAQARAKGATQDPDVAVRLAAARVLAHGGAKAEALAILTPALEGEVTARTIEAAVDLIHLGDARGDEALARATSQATTAELRAKAVAAHRLARKMSPALFAALADASGTVRVEAAATLAGLARQRE